MRNGHFRVQRQEHYDSRPDFNGFNGIWVPSPESIKASWPWKQKRRLFHELCAVVFRFPTKSGEILPRPRVHGYSRPRLNAVKRVCLLSAAFRPFETDWNERSWGSKRFFTQDTRLRNIPKTHLTWFSWIPRLPPLRTPGRDNEQAGRIQVNKKV